MSYIKVLSDYDSDMEQFLSVRLVCLQFFNKGFWGGCKKSAYCLS